LRSLGAGAPVLRVEPSVVKLDMAWVSICGACLDESAKL
jgi:hypothetical protein